MDLDDPRWTSLLGGYRIPFDPRSALRDLEDGRDVPAAWETLWENLHHQGDVGEASYAAVPHIVRICSGKRRGDWNAFALVDVIEEARREPDNPPIPDWLRGGYDEAWRRLFDLALVELPHAKEGELVRSLIAVIARSKGQDTLAQMALLTEDERREMLDRSG